MTEWTVPARVERVIDGDTVAVVLDLGWGLYKRDHIRVAHINAPETNTTLGKQAKSYAEELLPVSLEVTVVSHSLDKYGRALATILFPDKSGSEPLDFGATMVKMGHAVPWEGSGPKP